MKSKTLEEIVNTPQLEDGVEVQGRITQDNFFNGKIVGVGSSGLMPAGQPQIIENLSIYYIVECTDGTFPNEVYPYKFLSLPLSEIFVK